MGGLGRETSLSHSPFRIEGPAGVVFVEAFQKRVPNAAAQFVPSFEQFFRVLRPAAYGVEPVTAVQVSDVLLGRTRPQAVYGSTLFSILPTLDRPLPHVGLSVSVPAFVVYRVQILLVVLVGLPVFAGLYPAGRVFSVTCCASELGGEALSHIPLEAADLVLLDS